METPQEAAQRVFGARAEHYTTSAAHTDPQVLARVVELAAPRPEWRALDVATGSGHTALALAPHVRFVLATDLTREMLGEACRLAAARGVRNVAFCRADAQALPCARGSFDLVGCRRAAHHFPDLDRALEEMRRALRAGGRLVIDDRSGPEDDAADDAMNRLDKLHDESHVRQYRPQRWRATLEAHGFAVAAVEPYVKHRPLSSLTAGVDERGVRAIRAELERMDGRMRAIFRLEEKDGQTWLNHWYVMLAAVRRR